MPDDELKFGDLIEINVGNSLAVEDQVWVQGRFVSLHPTKKLDFVPVMLFLVDVANVHPWAPHNGTVVEHGSSPAWWRRQC